jgi:hypothetical protein
MILQYVQTPKEQFYTFNTVSLKKMYMGHTKDIGGPYAAWRLKVENP